ncbi:MAG: DASH family cryptochrome [Candidatus Arcticimaribacter sp.]
MQKRKGKALVWLRNDLRIKDQASFYHATHQHETVIALYSFDPLHYSETQWGFKKTEAFRAQFLLESLAQLQKDLLKHNISLVISQEDPAKGMQELIKDHAITELYWQKEWTQEEREREEEVRAVLSENISVHSHYDQFLFHPEDVPMEIDQLPEVFTVFRKKCEKYSKVRSSFPEALVMPESNLLHKQFTLPSLADLGLKTPEVHPNSAFPFRGGSLAAQLRLEHYFWDTEKLSFYKQTRNGLVGLDYSSKFSAWLANGSISARQIYWEIKEYEAQIQKNQSTYWLIFELIWRDYFKFISLKHQDRIFQLGGILQKDYHWKNNPKTIQAWIDGETREPFVNANMIELQKTGWMSNRGRQNVTSYLAKDLLLDWRIGAAYFEAQLIDYDVHSNYGNWMYVAGVGNDPRDRKFNVRMQAERYDENGKFQRQWNQKSLFE